MRWWAGGPQPPLDAPEQARAEGPGPVERRSGAERMDDPVRRVLALARLEDLLAWGRKNSLWPFNFGLSCCYVEMATSLTSKYDIARFGAEVIRGTPREADVMVVAGTVFLKMAPIIKRLHEQMMEPRWVISMGSCANSGGMYDVYSVVQGVDKFLPVDVYVQGCPPRPDSLMEGLLMLREAVGAERRPLGWWVKDRRVLRPDLPPRRELKREARRRQGWLEPPDTIGLARLARYEEAGRRGEGVEGSPRAGGAEERSPAAAPLLPPEVVPPPVATPAAPPEPDAAGARAGEAAGAGKVAAELRRVLGEAAVVEQATADGIPTLWIPPERLLEAVRYLKEEADRPYRMLYDLTAVDERHRRAPRPAPAADFTAVYHLLSLDRREEVRLKVALAGLEPAIPSLCGVFESANWYEREAWDLMGVRFEGHPHLARIMMPAGWEGHPLRKDRPARATELGPYRLSPGKHAAAMEELRFVPEDWGLARRSGDTEFMFLNVGPQHPGTHGVLRIVLQLDGEQIVNAVPDIGYHHRAAEKMGERQTWHGYIPYTDRVDYLGGVMNELPYVMAVEKLCGIEVPARAKVIRILMCEVFRIYSHLVWYGTFAQDVGSLSPVFYMFNDRERLLEFIEAVTGFRMHPGWFRIGGTAQDLPRGWDVLLRDILDYLDRRLPQYDGMVLRNGVFRARTRGVGAFTQREAIEWGVTGPGLRATGLAWDLRKVRPYGGYDWFDFEVPTAAAGDSYARAEVRVEEMRQSLRILRQCLVQMPAGPHKADHPLTTPPPRGRTMHDIETLIQHFLNVTWGPVVPAGEASVAVEATKGINSYYLISDGNVHPYRVRIRAPSFPHMQMLPAITRGLLVSDLLAILGAMDFVLADVDR